MVIRRSSARKSYYSSGGMPYSRSCRRSYCIVGLDGSFNVGLEVLTVCLEFLTAGLERCLPVGLEKSRTVKLKKSYCRG